MKKDRTEQRTERFYYLIRECENGEELKIVYKWFRDAFCDGKITAKQLHDLRLWWYERLYKVVPIKK